MDRRNPAFRWTLASWVVLTVSLILRIILVEQGGQQFWPDEDRFDISRKAAADIMSGNFYDAAQVLLHSADHPLFKMIATGPALLENYFHASPRLPALFFAFTSSAMLWLLGRLVRASGAGEKAAFFTVFMAGASVSLFYYSRHFYPYDLSLCLFFLSITLGLNVIPKGAHSFWGGLLASLGFLIYEGYWTLVILSGAFYLVKSTNWRSFGRSIFGFGSGFVAPILCFLALSKITGASPLSSTVTFSQTAAMQGDLDEAWRYVGEYLWNTEGVNLLFWILAIFCSAWVLFRGCQLPHMIMPILSMVALYTLIVLGSDIFLHFAVAARHVRIVVPFAAWTAGTVLAWMFGKGQLGKIAVAAICSAVFCIAAIKFRVPLTQRFPRDFASAARLEIKQQRLSGLGFQPLSILNDGFFHNPTLIHLPPPDGIALWTRPHPFSFVPYLFEGYDEKERREFLARTREMTVVRYSGANPIYHFPLAFTLTYLARDLGFGKQGGPILCSGKNGAGDVIFITYQPGNMASIGLDHWGAAAYFSSPFPFDLNREHVLNVIAPSLTEAKYDDARLQQRAELWRHKVYVSVDGEPVLNISSDSFPSNEQTTVVGINTIGSTSTVVSLNMDSVRFSPLTEKDWKKAEETLH